MASAKSLPPLIDIRSIHNSDAEPCKLVSDAYEKYGSPGSRSIVPLAPSVGIACLKSVPLQKKRDLELLDYLIPYLSYQSTLEILADPPEEYLIPGVDVLGGIEVIRSKLKNDEYQAQYEVMTDLQSIFYAASDGHFAYIPGLMSTFFFIRPHIIFQSVSTDGTRLPNIFMDSDIQLSSEKELSYSPSAVESIDGVPITEWLENDGVFRIGNSQDPDAQYNGQFRSAARKAVGAEAGIFGVQAEIPDSYTLSFYNGTTMVAHNMLLFPASTDFTGITSGEKLQERFELPPTTTSVMPGNSTPYSTPSIASTTESTESTTSATPEPTVPGYPYPVVKHPLNSFSGYFLNETGFEDTAVFSILEFEPGNPPADFNVTEYIVDAKDVFIEFLKKAKVAKREKLIIDLSNNGGGYIELAESFYALLFPKGEISNWGRYRNNVAFDAFSEANWKALASVEFPSANPYPINPQGHDIKTGKQWFGPYTVEGGQNVTSAARGNPVDPIEYLSTVGITIESDEAPFAAENILIVTDGICASSCTIFTGLLNRNQGVRTLALGGRPMNLAMQALGGVKGTQVQTFATTLENEETFIAALKNDTQALRIIRDAIQALPKPNPPLLSSTGSLNLLSGYTVHDLEGYPVHFKYEAANGRLFYTQEMITDVTEIWRQAASVAWNGASCVLGSTENQDGTMGDKALPFDARVRSQAIGVKGPGSLN
ncbi:hypothetical protein BGZ61DRAFT_492036 [Ilyonectria robusta]|uniref:uncharacterized protein n=1 Tax=Ilyonectria robusta TaxID=1079257 RepID=UPI001E8D4573|nr:uncharacterized protein BGZ61DRAFT_492036 [Ilyonectria robusta]KAH8729861.1 hypothetical protein BGZ61DRAFT_492036 [Ilyonectria robusta]